MTLLSFQERFLGPSPWLGRIFWWDWDLLRWSFYRRFWSFLYRWIWFYWLGPCLSRFFLLYCEQIHGDVRRHWGKTWMFVCLLEGCDYLLCLLGGRGDESLIILIKVSEDLILSDFLDLETFRVEALFLQLLLVDILFFFGVLLPNPVNHLHPYYRLLIKYNNCPFIILTFTTKHSLYYRSIATRSYLNYPQTRKNDNKPEKWSVFVGYSICGSEKVNWRVYERIKISKKSFKFRVRRA